MDNALECLYGVYVERLGAKVTIVSSCSISNKNHYVNTARRIADEINGIFMNQFENMANYRAHYVGRPFNVCTLHISFYALFVKDPKFGRSLKAS